MYGLDIFKLPFRYTQAEIMLAELRGLGNCEGYITGHNGSAACFDLALEYKINIEFLPDGKTIEAHYWGEGKHTRYFNFSDFESEIIAYRNAVVVMTIEKLVRTLGNIKK
jgi:hypothetical protein